MFKCPDCGAPIKLDVGEEPSLRLLELARKVHCTPCGDMRIKYESAEGVARKAMHNADNLGEQIKKLTRGGEPTSINEKEELWNTQEKLKANMEIYKTKKKKMQKIASQFLLRAGMKIK